MASLFKRACRWAGRSLTKIERTVRKVPVVGKPIVAGFELTHAPLKLTLAIGQGERIDRAMVHTLRDQVREARTIAPYVQAVVSTVPVVGTGIAGGIGAASALADGQPIDQALIDGVAGALPGGPAARVAFRTSLGMVQGRRIDRAALAAARSEVPSEYRPAFDVGLALAQGQNIQHATADAIKHASADALREIASEAAKMAARNPLIAKFRAKLPSPERVGADLAMGMMAKSGLTPAMLQAARDKLDVAGRLGFDRALNFRTDQVSRAFVSVVKPEKVIGMKGFDKFFRQTKRAAAIGDPGAIASLASLNEALQQSGTLITRTGKVITGRWRYVAQ